MPRKTAQRTELVHAWELILASMRPRLNAAEDTNRATAALRGPRRFNEAAAECRGRPGTICKFSTPGLASMRPRLNAAEDGDGPSVAVRGVYASMRPRLNAAEDVASATR